MEGVVCRTLSATLLEICSSAQMAAALVLRQKFGMWKKKPAPTACAFHAR